MWSMFGLRGEIATETCKSYDEISTWHLHKLSLQLHLTTLECQYTSLISLSLDYMYNSEAMYVIERISASRLKWSFTARATRSQKTGHPLFIIFMAQMYEGCT